MVTEMNLKNIKKLKSVPEGVPLKLNIFCKYLEKSQHKTISKKFQHKVYDIIYPALKIMVIQPSLTVVTAFLTVEKLYWMVTMTANT